MTPQMLKTLHVAGYIERTGNNVVRLTPLGLSTLLRLRFLRDIGKL